MGKIIGESFDPYVAKQIEVRQKKLGAETRDSDLLTYTTSKTSWLRLTSGVDVDETKLSELGRPNQSLEKNKLAESYVLFGGANNVSGSSMPKGGLSNSYPNTLSQNASYGFNSIKDYGLDPLPGIESAKIVPKNRGSLREANIVIKAFNKEQFNIIETLYMRLKYSILLEWGHTMYFDNKEKLVTLLTDKVYKEFLKTTPIVADISSDISFGGFFPETDLKDIGIDVNANQNKILDLIKNQRKKSNGNYDGFLGWVTNFSWELSPEGVYTINLKAISYGDIIESLSITKPIILNSKNNAKTNAEDSSEDQGSPLEIILKKFKDLLVNTGFYKDNYRKIVKNFKELNLWSRTFGGKVNPGTYINGEDLPEPFIKDLIGFEGTFYSPENSNYLVEKEFIYLDTRWIAFDGEDNKDQFYIKLGSLLRIIQNFFFIYDFSQPKNPPLSLIDYNYDTTFCSIPKNLISADPRVCIIPSNISFKKSDFSLSDLIEIKGRYVTDIPDNINLLNLNTLLETGFLTSDNNTAKPLHIHVNIDFIIAQLQNNLDENGDLALYDFLSSILKGINSALAGTVDLGIYYDEETNVYSIIDNNPPKSLPLGDPDFPTQLNIKGIQNNRGSFTKSFSIKSEISNKFATQIAIGAQANNTSLGSNSVTFSNWNLGLKDRIISNKSFSTNPNSSSTSSTSSKDKNQTVKYLTLLDGGVNLGRVKEYKSHVVNYLKIERDIEVKNGNLLSKSFIPISLNLELDGLSGIKLFQKYTINDEILPKNYVSNIEFLTKGLSHSIDQSGWTTSIEGLSIPKQQK